MYDAGDHMKFGFLMAYTATVITEYLVNAHPEPNVLYIQVGDPELDHKCWDRPEAMTEKRPGIQISTSTPGTEVASETAAAMAFASLVFK
ncbi:endoglucanase 2-like protein [Tanacetum coccineum]